MKNKIEPSYFSYKIYIAGIFVVLVCCILYYFNILEIKKEMLYWSFAATAQSMAALFAVTGIFAIFRFQIHDSKLKHLKEMLRQKVLNDSTWLSCFGKDSRTWRDEEIVEIIEKRLNKAKIKRGCEGIAEKMNFRIQQIIFHENIREKILTSLKIPMSITLFTFILAIFFLVITKFASENKWIALIVVIIMLEFTVFSVNCIYNYIKFSTSIDTFKYRRD